MGASSRFTVACAGGYDGCVPDLGQVHGPLTQLFSTPKTADEWAPFVLPAARVEAFERDGFIHGIPLLSSAQVDALGAELTEITDPGHGGREYFYEYNSNESKTPGSVLFHALGAWRVRPAFHDVLWNPAFLMAAYQLLGTSFRLFHDQVFAKPARHGGVVAWHQDYSYWTWTQPMAHLTCWMALDDVDRSNGCVHYVPGSHRWGLVSRTDLGGDMDAIRKELTDAQLEAFERRVPVEMKRGEASFHHPLLMHGSYANESDRPRRATLINVLADGVRSNMPTEARAGVGPGTGGYPVVPCGEPMAGPLYPLLLDPGREFASFLGGIPTARRSR